ncbi:TetR/AcrR family transcriptional regulator [Paracoccus sp. SCSIO 75233]|uniref:TetR/AcrR family transcriptional regulator n=1 Tax=Paracoccus sp. SCSIO 75233 TaxID=3017782 RepID=UPI0022F122CA|nr:TetR/AcrR family transcriptional regulator [Paracoccus sp. SCSIO 75233]WBU53029.1 TetR/AcrR family transcriptional regulator [Paracoccus sp. SCSIO 75233]
MFLQDEYAGEILRSPLALDASLSTPLSPRKHPRQQRSRATCEAILEAAARILETGGAGSLTTNLVAERAGVSIGSLYQYFPNKEAILAGLIRNMRREMLADFRAAAKLASGEELKEAVAILTRASIAHHLRRPTLAEELERAEAGLPLDQETQVLKAELLGIVSAALAERGVVPQPEKKAFDLISLSQGLVGRAIRLGERDLDDLHRRLCAAVIGYLNGADDV